jgi:hypothetical protein
MSLPIVLNARPSDLEIAAALMSVAGRYVEFRYVPQLPPRKKTPSVVAKEASEIRKGEPDVVRAFLDPELTTIRQTAAGHWTILCHTMNRVCADNDGAYAPYDYAKGEYLPRCYRVEGIRLDTLLVNDGAKGKQRLFPMAPATN